MSHWPHSPPHHILIPGTYMVTAATYQKKLHFHSNDRLQHLHDQLLELAKQYAWEIQAWAVLANHYHFIARSKAPENLSAFLSHLHINTARYVNNLDNDPQRRVWWQYWDTRITYQYSYLARLNYVNKNAVRHGLVKEAIEYPWCSAAWFEEKLPRSFCQTVSSFKIDKINVIDDF